MHKLKKEREKKRNNGGDWSRRKQQRLRRRDTANYNSTIIVGQNEIWIWNWKKWRKDAKLFLFIEKRRSLVWTGWEWLATNELSWNPLLLLLVSCVRLFLHERKSFHPIFTHKNLMATKRKSFFLFRFFSIFFSWIYSFLLVQKLQCWMLLMSTTIQQHMGMSQGMSGASMRARSPNWEFKEKQKTNISTNWHFLSTFSVLLLMRELFLIASSRQIAAIQLSTHSHGLEQEQANDIYINVVY